MNLPHILLALVSGVILLGIIFFVRSPFFGDGVKSDIIAPEDKGVQVEEGGPVKQVTNENIGDVEDNEYDKNDFRTVLDMSGSGLSRVPEYVFSGSEIEVLDLSNNNLTGALQAEVRGLSKLRVLDLSYNAFTGVPAEVGALQYLEVLDLSDNQLTGLPYEIGNLKNLKKLDVSGNAYAEADLEHIRAQLPATTVIVTE